MLRLATVTAVMGLLLVGSTEARERPVVGKVVSGVAGLPPRKPFPPRFTIRYEPCPTAPDALGCADVETGVVYAATRDRFTRWHELGHVFDWQVLTDADRAWFTRLLGFPAGTAWWSDDAMQESEGASPSEQFADAYAACGMGRSPAGRTARSGRVDVEWTTGYDYYPSVRQHQRICTAIMRASN